MATSDQNEVQSYFNALEELRGFGIVPPEASLGVVAFNGEERTGASEQFDVNFRERGLESSSSFYDMSTTNASSENIYLPDAPPLQDQPVASTSLPRTVTPARGNNNRRQPRRKRKIDEYFEKLLFQEGDVTREQYKCLQCDFVVTQKKPRERTFHVILCPRIPVSTRWYYYKRCSDAEMPPFFEHPPYGLTARSARRLYAQARAQVFSRLNCMRMKFDPTREPRLGHYLLAKEKVKKSTPIGKCSPEESKVATDLLLQFIVEENIPFAACDNKENHPRPLARLLSFLRPGFKLPLGYRVRGSLLNEYYSTLSKDVRGRLQSLLRECRGTVMFDGSEDINGAPMVNILLRVMGSARISTTTFFLTTIYTGYDTVDAEYYVQMTEKVVERFGGFSNIAAVVTDNTGCVKNAREALERKYPRLVASQDQAHVADRLIADVGGIVWVKETLSALSSISSVFRRLRKLRARFVELMKQYNSSLQNTGTTSEPGSVFTNDESDQQTVMPDSERSGEGASEVAWEEDVYRRDGELSHIPLMGPLPLSASECLAAEEDDIDETRPQSSDPQEHTSLHEAPAQSTEQVRTAVTMKKLSNVRFASSEGLLDEFIRTRPVLVQLVNDELFTTLYSVRNENERLKREETFRGPVLDEGLLKRAKHVHRVFRACRVYLRVFDSETSIASEVYEATRILKDTLERMPSDSFPAPEEQKKQELLEIFENRLRGPLPGRKRVKITLLSDLHIAAALLDPYRTPTVSSPHMGAFRRHLEKYLHGVTMPMLGLEESKRRAFFEEVVNQYLVARAIWESDGIMRETSNSTARAQIDPGPLGQAMSTRSPIAWWCTGALSKPADIFQRKAVEELTEFAIRTLSVSPTATATERTFSLENRIHTSQRANLAPEKVRKLLFCQWNSRVLRNTVRRDELDVRREAERQVEGIRKLRSVRFSILDAAPIEESLNSSANHPTNTDSNEPRQPRDYVEHLGRNAADGSTMEGSTQGANVQQIAHARTTSNTLPVTLSGSTEDPGRWLEGMFRAALQSTFSNLHNPEEHSGASGVPHQAHIGETRPQTTTHYHPNQYQSSGDNICPPPKRVRR